jgi:hypothetical protein
MAEHKEHPGSFIDWAKIEAEYVTGDISLKQLAAKHDIVPETLYNHSSADKWGKKRTEYRDDYKLQLTEQTKANLVDQKNKIDTLTDRCAEVLLAQISQRLTAAHKASEQLPVKDLKIMAETVEKAQSISYRRLGIPPPSESKFTEPNGSLKKLQDILNDDDEESNI